MKVHCGARRRSARRAASTADFITPLSAKKRTKLDDYRLTARGGKGVINMKTTGKTGKVVGVLSVREDSDIIIVSQNGKIIRIESSTIRQVGRSTQGVRLVSLEEGDKVAAASVIPETEDTNGNGQESLPLQ